MKAPGNDHFGPDIRSNNSIRSTMQPTPHVDAPHEADNNSLEFISGERRESEYRKAVSHRNRVRFLRVLAPVLGGLIILGLVAALVIQQLIRPQIDLQGISVDDGKLVMENPTLNGFDQEQRPYKLTAEKAFQDMDKPKRVELVSILATLPIDEESSADIKAGNGIYDAEAKTLVLTRQVHVQTSTGIKVDLEDADVDIGKGTLVTKNPVFASSRQADISSMALTIQEKGDHLVFEGQVRMTIRPDQFESAEDKQ